MDQAKMINSNPTVEWFTKQVLTRIKVMFKFWNAITEQLRDIQKSDNTLDILT